MYKSKFNLRNKNIYMASLKLSNTEFNNFIIHDHEIMDYRILIHSSLKLSAYSFVRQNQDIENIMNNMSRQCFEMDYESKII